MTKTTTKFIEKAIKIHGEGRYNYDKVKYVNNKTHVILFCNICQSEFTQSPASHYKHGCDKCARKIQQEKRTKKPDEFINEARAKFGNNFQYNMDQYVNLLTPIDITCNNCNSIYKHTPKWHLLSKTGCKRCSFVKMSANIIDKARKEFITNAKKVHGNKYGYTNIIYKSATDNVEIYCNSCKNSYLQKPTHHLRGQGCYQCKNIAISKALSHDKDIFIKKAELIHGNRYNYDNVVYTNCKSKVNIKCLKCKQTFSQTAGSHLSGKGCSYCKQSKGEILIGELLEKNNLIYVAQKKFDDCKYIRTLIFDFYIERYNLVIENDGKQHYEPIDFYGGKQGLEMTQTRDSIKNDYCKTKGISMLRIRYDENIEEKLISALICHEIFYKLLL